MINQVGTKGWVNATMLDSLLNHIANREINKLIDRLVAFTFDTHGILLSPEDCEVIVDYTDFNPIYNKKIKYFYGAPVFGVMVELENGDTGHLGMDVNQVGIEYAVYVYGRPIEKMVYSTIQEDELNITINLYTIQIGEKAFDNYSQKNNEFLGTNILTNKHKTVEQAIDTFKLAPRFGKLKVY